MTLDIEKIKAAAMEATQQPWILNSPRPTPEFKDYISGEGEYVELDVGSHGGFGLLVWRMEDDEVSPKCQANARHIATANPQTVLELITRLEAAESELNVCSIEYGDVRDSYLHYKERCESAEKDAAKWHKYQAKKKVLADRGFGKSPMRDMKESEK